MAGQSLPPLPYGYVDGHISFQKRVTDWWSYEKRVQTSRWSYPSSKPLHWCRCERGQHEGIFFVQFLRTNRKLLRVRFNEITPLGSSINVRNRAESIYPPDLDPLVYDRLQYLSMFESLDSVSEETKKNIQAVRKLYLSKALVPNKGHTMYFRKGQPITGWFDEIKGFPALLIIMLKTNSFDVQLRFGRIGRLITFQQAFSCSPHLPVISSLSISAHISYETYDFGNFTFVLSSGLEAPNSSCYLWACGKFNMFPLLTISEVKPERPWAVACLVGHPRPWRCLYLRWRYDFWTWYENVKNRDIIF